MLTAPDNLSAVDAYLSLWRWGNVFMGAAIVPLLAGLSILTTLLEGKERVFSRLGLVGFSWPPLCGSSSQHFVACTVQVAQEMTTAGASGTAPAYYAPLAQWAFSLIFIYDVLGFLALAAHGISLLQCRLVPAWAGWATLIFSIAMLIVLFIRGNNLPIFHYLPSLLIGILLLFHP